MFAAPSIANVQAAIEHIYPLVVQFRMDKPQPRSADSMYCSGGSSSAGTQNRHHINARANDCTFD